MGLAAAVEAYVAPLRADGRSEALASMAVRLAESLDEAGVPYRAALNKELRATLAELVPEDADGTGDSDGWLAELSSPVLNS